MLIRITTLFLALGHTVAQWNPPSCVLSDEIELEPQLTLRQAINPDDGTLTMQLVYKGLGYIGVGFSDAGTMAGSDPVVIGVPDNTETPVGFYNIGSSSAPSPQLTGTWNLENASLRQTEEETILQFTMPVVRNWKTLATDGETSRIIYAWGANNLSYHRFRGSKEVTFNNCVAEVSTDAPTLAPTETPTEEPWAPPTQYPVAAPTKAPTEEPWAAPTRYPVAAPTSYPTYWPTKQPVQEPTSTPVIPTGDAKCILSDEIELEPQLTLRQAINAQDNTISMQLVYKGLGYIGVGFSEAGTMAGSSPVVIGVPANTDTPVGFYNIGSSSSPNPQLTGTANLQGATLVQTDDETILSFTMPVVQGSNTLAVAGKESRIIYAWGANNLSYHRFRASKEVTFTNCVAEDATSAPTPVPPPTAEPTSAPTTSGDVVPIDVEGCNLSDEIELEPNLTLRQAINEEENTITMQLIFQGLAWVGVGFSEGGTMAGSNPVVLGVPDNTDDPVAFYSIGSSSSPNPQLTGTANLQDASLLQTADETILTFTMPVTQGSSTLAVAGQANRIIYAWGSGNSLSIHRFRGSKEVTFGNCVPDGVTSAPTPVPPPTAAPSSAPTSSDGVISIGNAEIALSLDEEDGTMTTVVTYDGLGWVGFGTSSDGLMVGGEVIIGIPGEGTPEKWTMNARNRGGIQRRPDEEQTLINASIEQTDTQTILTFTKLLKEEGEIEILGTEANTFIYAAGPGNEFNGARHIERFTLENVIIGLSDVTRGGNELKRKMWAAHGFFMAMAWGVFVPLAVGASMCRNILPLPAGMWFQIHLFLNSMAIIFTIIGFAIAVAAINEQQGENAKHFEEINHRKVGLAIFLIAVIQGGVALFRPHPPAPPKTVEGEPDEENDTAKEHEHPEKKSIVRFLWEIKHRVFGLGLLAISWWNVDSGFEQYNVLFGDDMTNVFWGITGTISILVVVGFVYSKGKTAAAQAQQQPTKPDSTIKIAQGEDETEA